MVPDALPLAAKTGSSGGVHMPVMEKQMLGLVVRKRDRAQQDLAKQALHFAAR